MRVLGIDTSLRCTGWGVVERQGSRLLPLDYGCLKTERSWRHSECLLTIATGIEDALERFRPDEVAIEGAFFCKNIKTAMVLGEARGVAIAACARRGLPIYEFAPRRVKLAVAGVGSAQKEQVMKMVMRLLSIPDAIQEDAADALALAITRLNSASALVALSQERL